MLPSYRVIFELLWRDYFKFVAVKYGNRLFQVEGTIALPVNSVSVMQKVNLKLILPFFILGLQDKSVAWKTDMKLFDAWKGLCLFGNFQLLSACYFLPSLQAPKSAVQILCYL